MIELKNVNRSYGKLKAVEDVNLKIENGEIVGLLGHNGAGKTTILKMLTGYLDPDCGEILISGMDIENNRIDIQKLIGYLPENDPLYPDMTVMQYLNYIAELRHISEKDKSAALTNAVSKTGLTERLESKISTLSKGLKQRVGVAQAIMHSPKILILDEPANGLDPSQINIMRNLIRELSKKTTIIISTHILQEVEAVCDRVIIINRGKKIVDSKLNDISSTDTIELKTDVSKKEFEKIINKTDSFKIVENYEKKDINCFKIKVDGDVSENISSISERIINNKWKLFGIAPEMRNLETVFREINESSAKGGN